MRARVASFILVVAAALCVPAATSAQGRIRDLEIDGGVSGEIYRGKLPAASVSVSDSTDHAEAAIGELGAQGTVALHESERRWAYLAFDGGLRQFAASGFTVRDYAPREWTGRASLSYAQLLGSWATATAQVGWRARTIEDRPPMPLFLQPGYGIGNASVKLQLSEIDQVGFDAAFDVESANYSSHPQTAPLDLLDRNSQGLEVGAAWGESATFRVFGSAHRSEYPNQKTLLPSDSTRVDRTVQAGFTWKMDSPVTVQLGVDGTINRSNSRRPEYDAVSTRAVVSVPLPFDVGATLFGLLTTKSYISQTDSKVLVPGEEANNASILYLDLARGLGPGLDASVRAGWTRAEADVGNAYFQRFGISMQMRYRPGSF